MKQTALLITPLAFLLACETPQTPVSPQNQTTLQSEKINLSKLSPVIQITDYLLVANGEKTVTLNESEFSVSRRLVNAYAYDEQNRLLSQKTTVGNNSNWWEERTYQYTSDLTERYRNSENKDFVNTLLLTDKGFLKGNLGPDEYTYDAEGYLISYKGNGQQDTYTIKDNNVVARETVYSSGLVQKNVYEYDLTKASIPSPLTFRGKQTRNLLIKQTMVSGTKTTSVTETNVFVCTYDFDKESRPIREFVLANTEKIPRSIREFTYR
ncbi:hypothetical protein GCM10028807_37580 [Spirosoma daeguense]